MLQLRWLRDCLKYELNVFFHTERSYLLMDRRWPAIYPAEIRLIGVGRLHVGVTARPALE